MRRPRFMQRKTAAPSPTTGVHAAMRVPSVGWARSVISIAVTVATGLGAFGMVMTQAVPRAAAATSAAWADSFSFQGSTASCGTFQNVALPATTTSITNLVVAGGGAGSAGGSGNGTSGAGGYGAKVSASTVTLPSPVPAFLNRGGGLWRYGRRRKHQLHGRRWSRRERVGRWGYRRWRRRYEHLDPRRRRRRRRRVGCLLRHRERDQLRLRLRDLDPAGRRLGWRRWRRQRPLGGAGQRRRRRLRRRIGGGRGHDGDGGQRQQRWGQWRAVHHWWRGRSGHRWRWRWRWCGRRGGGRWRWDRRCWGGGRRHGAHRDCWSRWHQHLGQCRNGRRGRQQRNVDLHHGDGRGRDEQLEWRGRRDRRQRQLHQVQ